jgi:GNAT superfamily N-acetyltransferase
MSARKLDRRAARPDPAGLALRIERAEAEQLARNGEPGARGALPVAGGLAVSKGPRSPFSAAFGLGLAGPVTGADVDRVEAHLGALGGDVRIELCPQAHRSLPAELARRGYAAERMLEVLRRPPGPPTGTAWAGREVRPIRPGEERAWADAFSLAHLGSPASGSVAEDVLAVPRARGNACFAVFEGGLPVAVAIVSAHGGVATLSGAGVVPAWRGRGLQLALVEARLAWAEEAGCDVAAAATDPGGASRRTLERAGFRLAYPKVVMVRRGWAGAAG